MSDELTEDRVLRDEVEGLEHLAFWNTASRVHEKDALLGDWTERHAVGSSKEHEATRRGASVLAVHVDPALLATDGNVRRLATPASPWLLALSHDGDEGESRHAVQGERHRVAAALTVEASRGHRQRVFMGTRRRFGTIFHFRRTSSLGEKPHTVMRSSGKPCSTRARALPTRRTPSRTLSQRLR
jgi:hypothetical protein